MICHLAVGTRPRPFCYARLQVQLWRGVIHLPRHGLSAPPAGGGSAPHARPTPPETRRFRSTVRWRGRGDRRRQNWYTLIVTATAEKHAHTHKYTHQTSSSLHEGDISALQSNTRRPMANVIPAWSPGLALPGMPAFQNVLHFLHFLSPSGWADVQVQIRQP